MAAEDDLDLLAGEYVLGVLAPDERAAVERRLLDNPDLAARVAAWQVRLAPLAEDLAPVTPRPAGLAADPALADGSSAASPGCPGGAGWACGAAGPDSPRRPRSVCWRWS